MSFKEMQEARKKLEGDMEFLKKNKATISAASTEEKIDYLIRFSNITNFNVFIIVTALKKLLELTNNKGE